MTSKKKSKAETSAKPFILIADTLPYILNYLAGIFQLAGFEVRAATTSQECLDIFRGAKNKIDIVLLDGAIASDEGVDVILNIRREKPEQKIMVVLEQEGVKAHLMRVGADVIILKPITAEAILQKVNDMLISKEPSFLERKKAKYHHGH